MKSECIVLLYPEGEPFLLLALASMHVHRPRGHDVKLSDELKIRWLGFGDDF